MDHRTRLDDERRSLLCAIAVRDADVAGIVAAREGSNVDDEHDPEGSTIAFERTQADHAAANARRRLLAVEAALGRLDDGTYGVCEVCGEPIAEGRLEALPATTRCVRCASGQKS
ncbi:TraR/DksA C4-type zinc finger protein [Aeromicrobium sp. 50.2.37]|uniref:TraR/DksA family transcriptional regulator n=1 Tax=Aeromicrobium sp. 50.2.37 TaxID=2969305 RepID=UPI00214F9351|nr:TraR/DksA C4-type zinc finger protein [Aeromicrobium sp. 50.2.37]MCR4512964.1 TraR/DksA C4-type zinc finger protein [Aeromicrobium sp. 50.2.37]